MIDKQYSHSVTNYLLASYQGRFTFLNILLQLRYPGLERAEIERTKKALATVNAWTAKLWNGIVLFAPGVVEANTTEAKEAVGLLDNLKPEMREMTDVLKRILAAPNYHQNLEQVQWLVACFGRFAYGRDNYIRGYLEFAKVFQDDEMRDFYTPQLVSCEEDVKVANHFFDVAKGPQANIPDGFHEYLRYRCIHLPCVFATYLHDLNLLAAPFRGGVSFTNCEFEEEESKSWLNLGFEAPIAGYWRAYEFGPNDALSWLQIGVLDAGMAFEWRIFGFLPNDAAQWIPPGFAPVFARGWIGKGYTPERALEQIKAGINDPKDAPELRSKPPAPSAGDLKKK